MRGISRKGRIGQKGEVEAQDHGVDRDHEGQGPANDEVAIDGNAGSQWLQKSSSRK